MHEQITNHFPHPPCTAWGWRAREAGNEGMKLSLGRRWGWGKDVL